jgi:L-asparaginase
MATVEVLGHIGPDGPGILVLYSGGTIGMAPGPDGALAQVDLRELGEHMPFVHRLPIGLTVASFDTPIDSSEMTPADWVAIADAVVEHAPGHVGVVVLHGTDTMAYTASALSFLLTGIEVPIVLTGAQRPVTELRSDGRENLVASLAIAGGHHLQEDPLALVPEVTIFFDEVLLRGNRAVKVHADSYRGFESPNLPPLATAGTVIAFNDGLVRPPGTGPLRRTGGVCPAVGALRLHPGIDEPALRAVLDRPDLRGLVLETYGAGNGPTDRWFLDPLREAVERGVVVVVTTQCRAGRIHDGRYATGAALLSTGAVSGADMTFEAALTKLMVLADRLDPVTLRSQVQLDLAGELTT